MRVLVTGGAGFLGATIVRSLLARGHRVRVLDSGMAAGFAALDGTDAEIVPGDVREAQAAVSGIEAVIHLAARTSVPASVADPIADFEVNVGGTVRLLEAARAAGTVRRFVLASSAAVAGGAEPALREASLPRPSAPYGAGKAAAEAYVQAYATSYGISGACLRIGNAYGPYSLHKESVVHDFVRRVLEGRPLVVHGDGEQTRDFVHAADVAAAFVAALDVPEDRLAGRILPVGSGVETSINALVAALEGIIGSAIRVERRPERPGNVARSVLDVSAAEEVLGYRATTGLVDGLRATRAWFEGALGRR